MSKKKNRMVQEEKLKATLALHHRYNAIEARINAIYQAISDETATYESTATEVCEFRD